MIETPLAAHVADQRDEACAFMLGEPARDLVEQQHARRGGERAGELEPLAVEEGERAREPVRLVGKAAAGEDVRAAAIDLVLAAAPAERRSDDEVLEHGHAAERLRDLERAREPEMAAPLRRQRSDVGAGEQHAPGIGPHRAGRRCRTASSCRRRSAR